VIKIRAIKNIKPEEEITYNYGRDYFDCFIKAVGCKCIACAKKKAKLAGRESARARHEGKKRGRSRGRARRAAARMEPIGRVGPSSRAMP